MKDEEGQAKTLFTIELSALNRMQVHQHPEGSGVACARRVAGVCQSARKVPDKVESVQGAFPFWTFMHFRFSLLCTL